MKQQILKSVLLSLIAPVVVGIVFGFIIAISAQNNGAYLFFSMLINAMLNAHIVGLTMALLVLPGYKVMLKFNKVKYSFILCLGISGGVLFSVLFEAEHFMVLLTNAGMTALASGLFLYGLRRFK